MGFKRCWHRLSNENRSKYCVGGGTGGREAGEERAGSGNS